MMLCLVGNSEILTVPFTLFTFLAKHRRVRLPEKDYKFHQFVQQYMLFIFVHMLYLLKFKL